ncbi:hypothetical protein L6R53_10440 [Myxococcota bacterium]|nr:hypothetical protein [Myxococcota bacterium]
MRLLFVDDEAAHAQVVTGLLRTVLDAEVCFAASVQQALEQVQSGPVDLVIMDLFMPLGEHPTHVLGPRARRFEAHLDHLGGLWLLDELDRLRDPPRVLLHTASGEQALLDACGGRCQGRLCKPASAEHMLQAVLEALGLPVPG